MISRLPKWIEYGAFVLALVAGCINAIGLLGFEHQSVSHLSGTATLLGTSVLGNPATVSLHLAGVLFAFFLGASLSGYLLHGSTLRLGQHYDTALVVESLLLFGAFYLLSGGSFYGMFAASAACGLQNAMATQYSGAVVRTTHLTGIFTDLGIMLGAFLRGEGFDRRKALLFLIIISGFIAGGTLGAMLFEALKFKSLLVPGTVCLVLAGCYRLYSARYRQAPDQ
ncbi:YoaK family protein [Marinobacter sp. M1N3S26]|uniref:YoaK family protein n=1 Tax=Marinobacter sp. M1N3S26 TaxID=3382299 RepID=UPI00387AE70C